MNVNDSEFTDAIITAMKPFIKECKTNEDMAQLVYRMTAVSLSLLTFEARDESLETKDSVATVTKMIAAQAAESAIKRMMNHGVTFTLD